MPDFVSSLTKDEQKELKAGRAKVLKCACCGSPSYFGSMNLLALGIQNAKPACSYACNKKLGQVS